MNLLETIRFKFDRHHSRNNFQKVAHYVGLHTQWAINGIKGKDEKMLLSAISMIREKPGKEPTELLSSLAELRKTPPAEKELLCAGLAGALTIAGEFLNGELMTPEYAGTLCKMDGKAATRIFSESYAHSVLLHELIFELIGFSPKFRTDYKNRCGFILLGGILKTNFLSKNEATAQFEKFNLRLQEYDSACGDKRIGVAPGKIADILAEGVFPNEGVPGKFPPHKFRFILIQCAMWVPLCKELISQYQSQLRRFETK